MAKIKIILEDDNGQILNEEAFVYDLKIAGGNFNDLEGEVARFKQESSAKITTTFLGHLQNEITKKKSPKDGLSLVKEWLNCERFMVE